MNLWLFLTIVILAGVLSEVLKEFARSRNRVTMDQVKALEEEVARLRQQVGEAADLRQRIEVLEDIVTSSDYELERQFARLSNEEVASAQSLRADR